MRRIGRISRMGGWDADTRGVWDGVYGEEMFISSKQICLDLFSAVKQKLYSSAKLKKVRRLYSSARLKKVIGL